MIELRNVTKSYRSHTVLNSIDLTVSGGICALLGPNGAGKSTLLKLITGLEAPDAGTVLVNGELMSGNAVEARRKMGVLPEQLGLFDSLTVMENLQCVAPIYGLSQSETLARAESLLALLELGHGRSTFARDCSFGMRKKTALALALIHRPELLVLDEPFEGIDPSSSMVIRELLSQLSRSGTTILLTSHLLPTVEKIADRVLILKEGRFAWDSSVNRAEVPLEEMYFDLVGRPQVGDAAWLR